VQRDMNISSLRNSLRFLCAFSACSASLRFTVTQIESHRRDAEHAEETQR